jgi:hypothetical protein
MIVLLEIPLIQSPPIGIGGTTLLQCDAQVTP